MRDEESELCTPPDLAETAQNIVLNLLPAKSRKLYEKAYEEFIAWCKNKCVTNYSENVLLAYFDEKSKSLKSSSLWSKYSMIKATLSVNNNVDISKFTRLTALLKRKSDNYKPKKSSILTKDQLDKFINDAPDDGFLLMKVAAIFGIGGACRCDELLHLTIDDIQDLGTSLAITIRESKTKIQRIFSIIDNKGNNSNYLHIYRKYANLRPSHTPHKRFFIYYKKGKCSSQAVGKNTLGKIPYNIATFLKLSSPANYTGHCFRRTSATLLVDAGGDILSLKRHGGWKSSNVAEGYIENSIKRKIETAKMILAPNNDENMVPSTSVATNSFGMETDTEVWKEYTSEITETEKTEEIRIIRGQGMNTSFPKVTINNCENCHISINIK